jgi:hypothetical protein
MMDSLWKGIDRVGSALRTLGLRWIDGLSSQSPLTKAASEGKYRQIGGEYLFLTINFESIIDYWFFGKSGFFRAQYLLLRVMG